MIPAQYQVLVTRRPKYACRTCQEGVVQAPAPARLIDGRPADRAAGGPCAGGEICRPHARCTANRQILARQGIAIDRSILAFWVGYAAAEIKPLWRLMREELLRSTKLFADETTAPVLDPGRGRTKTGYFWVLARDDRPWRGSAPPAVVYSYAPGRGGEHAVALLKGYHRRAADRRAMPPIAASPIPSAPAARSLWLIVGRIAGDEFFDIAKSATGADRHRGVAADRRNSTRSKPRSAAAAPMSARLSDSRKPDRSSKR